MTFKFLVGQLITTDRTARDFVGDASCYPIVEGHMQVLRGSVNEDEAVWLKRGRSR